MKPEASADPPAALIAAGQQGDRAALDRLLHSQHDRIHAVCRRITGNDADADDATQEAMVAVVRGLARFDGRSKFATWVYRIATNAALDELRRRRRRPVASLDDDERQPVAEPGPGIEDGIVAKLDIDAALRHLAPEFRAAVVLRDLCGLDYSEIADVLGVPGGTVRSRIARGRAGLVQHLAGNPAPTAGRPSRRP